MDYIFAQKSAAKAGPHPSLQSSLIFDGNAQRDPTRRVTTLSAHSLRLFGDPAFDREIDVGVELYGSGELNSMVYNLIDGWIALYTILEDGRKQILDFALPGSILCHSALDGGQTTHAAQALTGAVVAAIPASVLERQMMSEPGFAFRLAAKLNRAITLSYDHQTSLGRRTASERVAYLLLELFVRGRSRWPGYRIEDMSIPLTQEHIAEATGLTGVHVNRVLSRLRKDRIVDFHYRRLTILDPDRLMDVASADADMVALWLDS